MYAKAKTEQIVKIGAHNSSIVSFNTMLTILAFTLKIIIVSKAAATIAVVVEVKGSKLNIAFIGVGFSAIGATFTTVLSI